MTTPIPIPASQRTTRIVSLLMALALAAGCADEGGEEGEGVIQPPETDSAGSMHARVTDDPGSGTEASASSDPGSDYTGTLSGRGDVEVSADEQTWYTMGAAQEFTVSLRDSAEVQMTERVDLPADTYRFVRINFADIEAVLGAGSTVDGRTLDGAVHLRLGDTGNAVTRQEVEAFRLEAGDAARIMLDLNSERWVSGENLERRQIPKDQFEEQAVIEIVGES